MLMYKEKAHSRFSFRVKGPKRKLELGRSGMVVTQKKLGPEKTISSEWWVEYRSVRKEKSCKNILTHSGCGESAQVEPHSTIKRKHD